VGLTVPKRYTNNSFFNMKLFSLLLLGIILASSLSIVEFTNSQTIRNDFVVNDNLENYGEDTQEIQKIVTNSGDTSAIIWSNLTIIDEPYQPTTPTVVSDTNNITHVFWTTIENGRSLFHKMIYANDTWSDTEVVFNRAYGEPIKCHAVSDKIGKVHLAYSWGDGPGSQHVFYTVWSNGEWSDEEQVDFGMDPFGWPIPAHTPQIAVDRDGRPHVIYSVAVRDQYYDAYQPVLYQRRVGVNLWTTIIFIGYSPPGNYRMIITDDNIVHVAYSRRITASYDTFQEIYYADKHVEGSSFGISELLSVDSNHQQLFTVPTPDIIEINGTIHIFGQLINEIYGGIYYTKLINGNWTEPVWLTNKTAVYGIVRLAAAASPRGEIVVTWPRNDYEMSTWTGGIHHIEVLDENATKTTAQLVCENYTLAFDPSISYDSLDRMHLVWWDNINSTVKRLYYIQGRFDTDLDGLTNRDELLIHTTDPYDSDTDDDLIIDGDEISLGRDPLNPDEDSDKILDGWELLYGLDPTNVTDAGIDIDIDGLTNVNEFTNNTNPLNNDTDFDLLSDGDEVLIHFTEPTDSDTDNDLLADGEEVLTYFTNPLLADTESDGLPDGYEISYSFNPLVNDSYTDPDGDLLLSIEEYGFGTNPIENDTDSDLLDDYVEIFTYFTNPLQSDSDNDFLSDFYEVMLDPLDDTYQTNNTYQTNPLEVDTDFDGLIDYVEIDITLTNPILNDTDLDGMLDGYEITYSLDPFDNDADIDNDQDGLTNLEEFYLLSNPNMEDTDLDQLTDYEEYLIGTSLISDDTDGDRLTDYIEYVHLHTNPTDPDPDEDGLDDYFEVYVFSCNPFDNDTDGDTLLDGEEVFYYGSSPTSRDTDGDDLEDQYEVAFDSDPSEVDTDQDGMDDYFEWLYGFNPRWNDGLLDADGDGLPNIEEFWLKGNPLSDDTDGDLLPDADEAYIYLSSLYLNDTDSDDISDFDEVMTFGTSPIDPDSDDDKLSDGEEILYHHTNPMNRDTDQDGYSDFEEIEANTNPLLSSSNPGRRTLVRVFTIFGSIVGVLILYYSIPAVFSRFGDSYETDWIKEGIDKRKKKTENIINNNKSEISSLESNSSEDS
jgi:hypothetical protein